MKSYSEAMYWMENKAWFVVNVERNRFELTKKATPRAIESFRMWLRQNGHPDNIIPVDYGQDVHLGCKVPEDFDAGQEEIYAEIEISEDQIRQGKVKDARKALSALRGR